MNIKRITDNLLCSGCGTCNAVCPRNAISMQKTPTMGLLQADINTEICTDCGICYKMCPSTHSLEERCNVTEQQIKGYAEACYVGRSLKKEYFSNAQSGGMVTAILSYLFDYELIDAAVSCRMEYGLPMPSIHYSIITTSKELIKNQRSCYTQVDIISALKETGQFKKIAIVGIPCQIQGLNNLMTLKKYSNIAYRIGLICDKSYSDLYMDAIVDGIKIPDGKFKIVYRQKNFIFKGTEYSYYNAPTVLTNEVGKLAVISNSKRMFLKKYFTLPKCNICWDKLNVNADIVLGDPWGLDGMYDKQQGDSVIIVRTDVGVEVLNNMKNTDLVTIAPVDIEDVSRGQSILKRIEKIKNVNWSKVVEDWNICEHKSKKQVIKLVKRQYRVNKIRKYVKGIFNIIKNILYN